MAKRIAVAVTGDPSVTHRPVEALRIALGLCSGEHAVTIILLGRSPILLTDEIDDVVDVEILEKYRPSFQHLDVPFWIEEAVELKSPLAGVSVSRRSSREIRALLRSAERTLVFS